MDYQHQQQQHQQQQRFEPYVRNKKELKINFQTCNYINNEERNNVFPHLKDINQTKASELAQAYTFVIRSNNDDDIHKSIKYGIWTSSKENNDKLSNTYKQAQEKGLQVYLFYSVVKSGQFVGVAKLTSDFTEESFPFWWEAKKWKGHFNVEWIQVKDVVNKSFEHLKNTEQIEVTRSRDGAEIDWVSSGHDMMKIYEESSDKNTILNDFAELDMREQALRDHKLQRYNQQYQQPQQQYYQQQPNYYYQQQQQQQQQQK